MLPASLRLTKRDFSSLKTQTVYRGEAFDLAKKEEKAFKVACVISKKKIKLATDRNAIRRRVLHALAAFLKENQTKGYFIIYPKALPRNFPYNKIEEEIYKAFATLQ